MGKSGPVGHSNMGAPLKLFTVGKIEVEGQLNVTGSGIQLQVLGKVLRNAPFV